MAKARSRTSARKMKDRWKAKNWYNILAPASFDNVTVADTLADSPDNLINRVTEVSLQDLTNDFRRSHIKLFFKINKVEETNAYTQFVGHTLTSDYLRRLIRRRRSKIDGVYDVSTRDGAILRVKPFATTDKRVQNSQKKLVREVMKKTFTDQGKSGTLSELVKGIVDGRLGREIYKNCKQLYPVKRVEIYKTEVLQQPTIMMEDKKPEPKKEEKPEPKKEEKPESEVTEKKEKKPKKKKDKETEEPKEEIKEEAKEDKPEEPTEEVKEEKPESEVTEKKEKKPKKKKEKETKEPKEEIKEEAKEDKPEEPTEEVKEEKPKKPKKEVNAKAKKTAAKKPVAKKPTANKTKTKTKAAAKKKTPAKKKTTKKAK